MLTNKELKELGVIKSVNGVHLPADFCLVSLLNQYQLSSALSDEHHDIICEFLFELEIDLGLCDGDKEEVKRFKELDGSINDRICDSCGQQGSEVFMEYKKIIVQEIECTIPAVPANRCTHCGEISYDQEALDYIEREKEAVEESRRQED
ncbi:hypothetical protein [Paenibacillus herberti]|uniref:YgiT-type zinc finger domain-containing protein n=1 Tax=Paenibacillus herberti TaxID=1619309 RepID=A0A229NVK5_9BACL|nr:hypothetical protein [Paenibacillus herberti]OXM13937.1 hypothetical protein CGZ75_13070 [Paenibacillus herberti]